jgi:hypothetical protein
MKISKRVKDEKEKEAPIKFDWDTFDLDKFFKDAKKVGEILHERDKLMDGDE